MCYNMQVVETRPVGQAVKTLASHAGNMGSIPVRVTKIRKALLMQCFFDFEGSFRYENPASKALISILLAQLAPSEARISISRTGHHCLHMSNTSAYAGIFLFKNK